MPTLTFASLRRTLRPVFAGFAVLAAVLTLSAADAAKKNFDLPAGAAGETLKAFAKQAGREIVFPAEAVGAVPTRAVKGEFAPREALDQMLADTGLVATQDAKTGAFAVRKETPAEPKNAPSRPASDRAAGEIKDGVLKLDTFEVMGTKLLNMDLRRTRDDPQPYVVFDSETVRHSGAQNIETFLRDRLPMNAGGAPNGLRVTTTGAQSRFNLRGLGAGQTLILINGRRTTPGPSGGSTPSQVDLNGIPLSAIERIEVLPATASGIYGGSATGGVINVILRQDYAGAEIRATYGNTFDGKGATRQVDLSVGFNLGSKTNVLLSASYSDQTRLRLSDRAALVERYYDIVRTNAPGLLLPPNNPPLGSTPNIRSATGANLVLDNGTALGSPITHVPAGYAGTATDQGRALVANAGQYNLDLADSTQFVTGGDTQILQAPRNQSLRASLQHEFTPRARAYLETSASESRTAGVTTSTIGGTTAPYRISASAPNNPFTTDILVTVPTDSFDEVLDTTVTQYRATGGMVVALPANWQAAADYTWGRTVVDQGGVQQRATSALAADILNGSLDVLRDTAADPIDLSSYLVVTNLEALRPITFQAAALRLGGPVADLPAGPLVVSTLLEHRDENFDDTTQISAGGSFFYPSRSASAASAYVETRIPLFSDKNRQPGLEVLDIQLATRFEQYRTKGATGFITLGSTQPIIRATNQTNSLNPTIAIRYQPIHDLMLRASYGTGFVAPDVSQLAPSVYPSSVTFYDPKRGGTATTLSVGQVTYQGNPDLEPEKSQNWSAGVILTPRFMPGFRLSLDYTRISKTDNIASYPTGFQGLVNDEGLFPDRVTRGANLSGDPAGWSGPITSLDFTLFNIAKAEVEAIDLQLDYSRKTGIGTFNFSSVATWQLHYKTTTLAGQPTIENVGISYTNPQKFVGNAELKWKRHAWTVGWLARHYSSYFTADPTAAGNAAAITLQGNGGRVPSQTYHDLFVSWAPEFSPGGAPKFLQGSEFQLGLRNIFDKLPPFDASYFNSVRVFHSPLGDPLGAVYQFSVTKRF